MVIGQDGTVIFVRHGGICVRVHQCRLRRALSNCTQSQNDQIDVTGVSRKKVESDNHEHKNDSERKPNDISNETDD